VIKACEFCNKKFKTFSSQVKLRGGKFCSRKCYYASKKSYVTCIVCGKLYGLGREHRNNGGNKFCSSKCQHINQQKTKILLKCLECNIYFYVSPSKLSQKFCSKNCANKYKTLDIVGDYPKEFYKIRKIILKEANNKCLICNEFANNVHHVNYNKMDSSELNLVALCSSCHAKTNYNRNFWEIRINWIIGCV
jgi:hypothetical protein